jgi:hypothetical protein
MLTGRFGDTSGRPYIEGRLLLPRFNIGIYISFLVDTGADRTVLMPLDGVGTGLDYSSLQNPKKCIGFGGSATGFLERGVIAFSDGIAVFMYDIELLITKPKRGLMRTPSVLGRDVLNRWIISYDFPHSRIEIQNHSADQIIAVTLSDGHEQSQDFQPDEAVDPVPGDSAT